MWIWLGAVPVAMFLLLFGLAVLEERLVSPGDRAAQIRRMLETEPTDAIERSVAKLLAAVVKPPPARAVFPSNPIRE